eukprot:scaffold15449_cov35-Prasinocladus_malaysianus.AAC.1
MGRIGCGNNHPQSLPGTWYDDDSLPSVMQDTETLSQRVHSTTSNYTHGVPAARRQTNDESVKASLPSASMPIESLHRNEIIFLSQAILQGALLVMLRFGIVYHVLMLGPIIDSYGERKPYNTHIQLHCKSFFI